jgi:soluble lytic murein transglycosylase
MRGFKVLIFIVIIAIVINYKALLKYFFPEKYKAAVLKYSTEYKIDPYIVYSIIKAESNFKPDAKSNKGAAGLMQITPQTGKYIASLLEVKNFNQEMLYSPDVNIKYGCFYLSKLFKDFNGDLDAVLAAYNGGEGNVRKWLKEDEAGRKFIKVEELPFAETRNYVQKVKRNHKIYKYLYTH